MRIMGQVDGRRASASTVPVAAPAPVAAAAEVHVRNRWAGKSADERRASTQAMRVARWADVPLRPCGTMAAYKRHLRNREATCGPCREAKRAQVANRLRERLGLTPAAS